MTTNRKPEQNLEVTVQSDGTVSDVRPLEERAIITGPTGPTARRAARVNARLATNARLKEQRTATIRAAVAKRAAVRAAEREAAVKAAAEAAGDPRDHLKQTYVRASQIVIPEEYQREFSKERAEGLAMRFKWTRFQAPHINLRPDGTMVAVDGQHRIWAAQRCFGQDVEIPVNLTAVATTTEEAGDFDAENTERRGLTYNSAFRARIHAKDEASLQVMLILGEQKLRPLWPGENQGVRGTVIATRTIEYMVKQGGASSARAVISILHEVWGDDPKGYRDFILGGLWQFLVRYDGYARRERVVEVLKGLASPTDLDKLTQDNRSTINSSANAACCGAIHWLYNRHMKLGTALPPYAVESGTRHTAIVKRYARRWRQAHELTRAERNGKASGAYSPGAQLPYQARKRDRSPS